MDFVVKKAEKIKVTNDDGKVYEINWPTFDQVEKLLEEIDKKEKSEIKLVKQYVVNLGLPSEVIGAWNIDTIFDFVEMVTARKKK